MKRIIKFRVWDGKSMDYDAAVGNGKIYHHGFQFFQVDQNVPVMQFTGIKDKNGKEIYDGDIIYFEGFRFDSGPYKLKVFWDFDQGCWGASGVEYLEFLANIADKSKVIGNIYEKKP